MTIVPKSVSRYDKGTRFQGRPALGHRTLILHRASVLLREHQCRKRPRHMAPLGTHRLTRRSTLSRACVLAPTHTPTQLVPRRGSNRAGIGSTMFIQAYPFSSLLSGYIASLVLSVTAATVHLPAEHLYPFPAQSRRSRRRSIQICAVYACPPGQRFANSAKLERATDLILRSVYAEQVFRCRFPNSFREALRDRCGGATLKGAECCGVYRHVSAPLSCDRVRDITRWACLHQTRAR